MDILLLQFSFFKLEFPSVKNFLCISKVRFGYPFIGNSIIFPSTLVHKSISFIMTFPSLFNDFLYFILLRVLS
jgi:hypothetical protein